jgi:hypothetical protein
MLFTKRLRDGVRRGEITCSVRIWQQPRVQRGKRYRMEEGQIEIDAIDPIELTDITPRLAKESGFAGVVDLLKTAKHGSGTNVYLVRFHYVPPAGRGAGKQAPARTSPRRAAKPADRARIRKRVLAIVERLPEASAVATNSHLSLEVRKKRFGYFLDDHHGDGRLALNCKASPDVQDALQQLAPAQLHVPKYLGSRGWIGLWLDTPRSSWTAVELALREAYGLVAPKTLLREQVGVSVRGAGGRPAASRRRSATAVRRARA